MLAPITIRYPMRPVQRSLITGQVADLFGLDETEPPHTIAENLTLDIRPGDVVLFSGPSGSGKTSLLRAVGRQLGAVDTNRLELPDVPLVEALPGSVEDRLAVLARCGLAEARLALRRPSELSEGERYRFRIALAVVTVPPSAVMLDEFAALLERPLAKVVAYNLRRLATRSGVGVLCATTHDDIAEDLNPDVWVCCSGERIEWQRREVKKKPISFAGELWLSAGTVCDWAYFARWHYRNHRLAYVRRVILLWHGAKPVGVCVFGAPAASLALRTRFFGLAAPRRRAMLTGLNERLWVLQRLVLHPTYRGAGIGAAFVRRACELCPVDWIETLAAMGRVNPVFERAGFVRVGVVKKPAGRGGAYTSSSSAATQRTGRYSEPVYYVFDNRRKACNRTPASDMVKTLAAVAAGHGRR
jgi:ABC-type ATPase with predicted acetyltransferase domain